MPVSRQQKEEILQVLVDKFAQSKSVVFADYRGLDVQKLSELRKNLRQGDAELQVAKKTLIDIASQKNNLGTIDKSFMQGPVAATFSYQDPLSGIKILFKFSKENEKLKLLGGIIDGKVVGPETIAQYAQLPSKEELLAKLLGSMNAPVSGFVGIMSNLMSGLVRVLDAYKDKMPAASAPAPAAPPSQEAAPPPAVEAPVEENAVAVDQPAEAEAPAEAA